MNAYYRVTSEIKTLLLADPDVNTVLKRKDMDLNKKDIFPVCNILVLDCTPTESTLTFSVAIEALDLRNESKTPITDKFVGNDNEDDNLNTMLYVLVRLYLQLLKTNADFRVTLDGPFEAMYYAGTNVADGWLATFNIELPLEEITAC